MKLFKFYPNRHTRMYVNAGSKENLLEKWEELFSEYHKQNCNYCYDEDDEIDEFFREEIERDKANFKNNIQYAEEGTFFIDSHY